MKKTKNLASAPAAVKNSERKPRKNLTVITKFAKKPTAPCPEEPLFSSHGRSNSYINQNKNLNLPISLSSDIEDIQEMNVPEVSESFINSSVESITFKELKANSDLICTKVKERLNEFRSLNKQSRNHGSKANDELKGYQAELQEIKTSVIDFMDEANVTKEQIARMKEKIEAEVKDQDSIQYEDVDLSTFRDGYVECNNVMMEQIKDLQQEILKIQNRIDKSEDDLKQKDSENKELKNIIEQLNVSIGNIGRSHKRKSSNCELCNIY